VILSCLIYFVVGLLRDAMATMWYQYVTDSREYHAGGLGGGLTAFDIVVLGLLIRSWSPALIVFYSLGAGLGTFIIVKLHKEAYNEPANPSEPFV
jgi:hypothetical protein